MIHDEHDQTLAAAALAAGLSTPAYAQDPHTGHGATKGGEMQTMEDMHGGMDPAAMQERG